MKIVGMVHLKTLPGYPQHVGMKEVIDQAVKDAISLQDGGVNEILVENTDDDPHQKEILPEVLAGLTSTLLAIKEKISLPLGVCVLWNDYRSSLALAKVCNLQFIRVPVFTEAVVTASGIIEANPYDVISYRDKLKANHVKILADVQVKHAASLVKRPLIESVVEALNFGADEIIITGRFTGDPPELKSLEALEQVCPRNKLVIGSGTTKENVAALSKLAGKAIVGTYFKVAGEVVDDRVKDLTNLSKL